MGRYETRVAESDPNYGSVGVTKVTIDRLLKQENCSDLLALYLFLSYTARWQETSQIKCTVSYISKGLGWGERKVQMRKSQLREIGLIEDVCSRNNESEITGWYVKVKYFVKVVSTPAENEGVDHPCENAMGGENAPKCLDTGNINALEQKGVKAEKSQQGVKSITEPTLPSLLDTERFRAAWEEYQDHRRKSGHGALRPHSIQKQWDRMAEHGLDASIQAIQTTIAQGWRGIFLNGDTRPSQSESPSTYASFI